MDTPNRFEVLRANVLAKLRALVEFFISPTFFPHRRMELRLSHGIMVVRVLSQEEDCYTVAMPITSPSPSTLLFYKTTTEKVTGDDPRILAVDPPPVCKQEKRLSKL